MTFDDFKQFLDKTTVAISKPLIIVSVAFIVIFILVPILFTFLVYQDTNPDYWDCLKLSLQCLIPIGAFYLIAIWGSKSLLRYYARQVKNIQIQIKNGEITNFIPLDAVSLANMLKIMNKDENLNSFDIKFLVTDSEKRILGKLEFSDICMCCKLDIINFFDILSNNLKESGYDMTWEGNKFKMYQIHLEKISSTDRDFESAASSTEDEKIADMPSNSIIEQTGDTDGSLNKLFEEIKNFSSVELHEYLRNARTFKNQKEALKAKDKQIGEIICIRGVYYVFIKAKCNDGYTRWKVTKFGNNVNLS